MHDAPRSDNCEYRSGWNGRLSSEPRSSVTTGIRTVGFLARSITVINNMTGLGGEKPQDDDRDFDALDRNHDGYLTFEEFAQAQCQT